jgi:2-polyprenyl-3-methyl-5-hydroxy-6-metoxy-1,4-benzoquinol methylase
LKPDEIEEKLKKLNLKKMYLDGLKFNILNSSWNLSNDCSVNYIMVAKKD